MIVEYCTHRGGGEYWAWTLDKYSCPGGRRDLGFYRRGSAIRRIFSQIRQRPPQDTNTATLGKGFPPYRTGLNIFSHLYALNVFSDGHPAEA
jgi:hypothetical protein